MTIPKILPAVLAFAGILWSQAPSPPVTPSSPIKVSEQPDAQRTRSELESLLDHYPPALRTALALDSSLLTNQAYLAPYPALINFLGAHPEIARDPSFYLIDNTSRRTRDRSDQILDMWRDVISSMAVFAGFAMGIGVLVWLIRTIIDYRRWSRLAKVQAEVHAKLLDRFTNNNDLLAYMQTPAGAKFLESTPIKLDAGSRSVGAPLSRILWSVQGGLVLLAGGVGLEMVSSRFADESAQPLHALGVLGMAVGVGFVASAAVSYFISHRLGLIEPPPGGARGEAVGIEGFGFRK